MGELRIDSIDKVVKRQSNGKGCGREACGPFLLGECDAKSGDFKAFLGIVWRNAVKGIHWVKMWYNL
jgi:hypothetical protein